MSDKFESFDSEISYSISLQILDKCLRKDITRKEMNEIMAEMQDTSLDFLYIGGTFVNKKIISILEFTPIISRGGSNDENDN